MRQTAAACATLVICVGCAGNGEGLDASGRPIDEGGPAPSGEFQQIQDTIFTPICTNCHAGATAPAGLRLDSANSFAMLVNVASTEVSTLMRVSPGDPDNSYLVQKLEGRAAVGARMPLGSPPLPQASIDLVRSWIAGGALAPTSESDLGIFRVVSTVPEPDEISGTPVTQMMVVFNAELDTSVVPAAHIEIQASGGDGSFSDGNERTVPLAHARVSPLNAHVLTLIPASPLADDAFRLVIGETSGISLADIAAHRLDGDADGEAGGEFTTSFRVAPEEAR